MPSAAPKPCRHAGCGKLVSDGSGYCEKHTRPGTFADKARGTRHERGYGSSWDKLRLIIIERDCGLCQPCRDDGRVTAASMVDHIRPKAEGGTDDLSNLRAICKPCHTNKTNVEKNRYRTRGVSKL